MFLSKSQFANHFARTLEFPEQQIAALFDGLKASLPVDCAFLLGFDCSNPNCDSGVKSHFLKIEVLKT